MTETKNKKKKLKIKLVRGKQNTLPKQRLVLEALGLRKREHVVFHDDTATILGMIDKVQHLVKVSENK